MAVLIAIGALAAVLGLAQAVQSGLASVETPAVADLRRGQRLWREHGIGHYRLEVERTWLRRRCYQQYEVRDGVVVKIEHNTCRTDLPTISQLFVQLERYLTRHECLTPACECHIIYSFAAAYDDVYGTPNRVTMLPIRLEPNRDHPRYIESEVMGERPQSCGPTISPVFETMSVRSLDVLP